MNPEALTLWLTAIVRHLLIPLVGLVILVHAALMGEVNPQEVGLGIGLLTGAFISSQPASAREGTQDGSPSVPPSDGHSETSSTRKEI